MGGQSKLAQAFTLEGVMASLLLLVVVYALFQSSLVISPMWSEITDAQLKLIGYDVLKVLDNPEKDASGKYLNSSLQGMLVFLNDSFKPNEEFLYAFNRLTFPAEYRIELYWVNDTGHVVMVPLVDKKPTPEAVAASRLVVIQASDFNVNPDSPFYGITHPVVFEVRVILWRP
jgi:hypothetical protein